MDKLQVDVSLALRDSETCTAAAEVRERRTQEQERPSALGWPPPGVDDQRAVLAVVTHRKPVRRLSEAGLAEEGTATVELGCLFVMKFGSSAPPSLCASALFPINARLVVSLKQTEGTDGQEFEITIRNSKDSILLGSGPSSNLSIVFEEIRRLRKRDDLPFIPPSPKSGDDSEAQDTAEAAVPESPHSKDDDDENWEWLYFYMSYRSGRTLPSQQPKPRDIRLVLTGSSLAPAYAGVPGDEDGDLALIRDEWVHRRLSVRKDEYSRQRSLTLRVGTFNVNSKEPTESLSPWVWDGARREKADSPASTTPLAKGTISDDDSTLNTPTKVSGSDSASVATATTMVSSPEKPSSSDDASVPADNSKLPDIFVLGFQELDLSAEAFLYGASTFKEDLWVDATLAALGNSAQDYVKLTSKQLVGVLIVVFVRKDLQSIVKEVSTSMAGVGFLGIMGNKGAAAVRLRLLSTTVTFVCAHLAASDDYVSRRNSDFAELARRLDFPVLWWRGTRAAATAAPVRASVWETDMLFWLGDLNYRIDLPDEEVRSLLKSQPHGCEIKTLLAYDQLRTSIREKRAFVGFVEHVIDFLPTYRFHDEWVDELGYDLKRRPAWTDRILHMAADPTMVSQRSYGSHPAVSFSDHRPVSADFDILVEDRDPHEHHRVAVSIFEALGDFEESNVAPVVTLLDNAEVDLGPVWYARPVSRTVRIKNESKVACAFRFVPLEPGFPICKEWLQLEPLRGILLPGETDSIRITVMIDKQSASFLNHGNTQLEDNLILHLEKGADRVIHVSGSYQPTCFANSLAWLLRSSGPVRSQTKATLLPERNVLSAPRELMFLIEWLMTNAQDVDDLFLVSADESLVSVIREHLDTQPLDTGSSIAFPAEANHRVVALAFGETLIQFLDSLTEPVIPWVLHQRCALAQSREDVYEIIDDIPGFARNVYLTVTAFLQFIAHSGGLKRSKALARVFADVLLRNNPRAAAGIPDLTPLGKRDFLLYTIWHDG